MLLTWFAVLVNRDRVTGRSTHLHPMFPPTIVVGNIPIRGCAAGDRCATLNVSVVASTVAATLVGTDQTACNGTACGGHVFTASAADLVTKHAADDCTENGTADVRIAAWRIVNLLTLYPAALFRWPDHRANIWVRGNLSHAYHTMEVTYPPTEKAKYFLGFPNGGAAAVFTGKNYQNLIERDAWFSGSFDGDKLRVTKSGYAVVPDPAISIFPWSGGVVDGGSNVPLDSDTNGGAAVVAATGSVGAAQGAGILRD